jgi:phosphatidylserine/phosphatidylglycerophosphate/cardiolipin synthase-like enzyme
MIKFLDGDAINAKISETIRDADEYLKIICPYIKLTEKIKFDLRHLANDKPKVTIDFVFGKNEDNQTKSLNPNDLDFLKSLGNIRIGYVKDLHAKIYCSEDRLILTSMNLHEFSQAHNHEAAFMIEDSGSILPLLNNKAFTAWEEAHNFVKKIIQNSQPVYQKGKVYEINWLGLSNKIIQQFDEDNSEMFFKSNNTVSIQASNGFCIRTGTSIPFNLKAPYCNAAYKSWKRFSNENYKEQYCHYSGEASNGETSLKSPILKKNWKEAKSKFSF